MSIQKVPLTTLQKVRQHIKNSLTFPDTIPTSFTASSSSPLDELPEPESIDALGDLFRLGGPCETKLIPSPKVASQWRVSTMNPAAALLKLPGVKLKPDYRMVSYVYQDATPSGPRGIIWALPESHSTTLHLETALAIAGDSSQPPHPDAALPDLMDAIEGDGSALSFVIASLLKRELQSFGSTDQSKAWNHHRLIDALPAQVTWQWRTDIPKDFSAKARVLPNTQAVVEFFTCRVISPVSIVRHVDQYPIGRYTPQSQDRAIAAAQR